MPSLYYPPPRVIIPQSVKSDAGYYSIETYEGLKEELQRLGDYAQSLSDKAKRDGSDKDARMHHLISQKFLADAKKVDAVLLKLKADPTLAGRPV